jgi:hypothetical protein
MIYYKFKIYNTFGHGAPCHTGVDWREVMMDARRE